MSDECCGGTSGCGCQSTSYYTSRICHDCGGKLRLSGNPYTIKYHLICPECGHAGRELTVAEFRDLMD